MSLIRCSGCGDIVDSDEYPNGFYREDADDGYPGDEYYCGTCQEEAS